MEPQLSANLRKNVPKLTELVQLFVYPTLVIE